MAQIPSPSAVVDGNLHQSYDVAVLRPNLCRRKSTRAEELPGSSVVLPAETSMAWDSVVAAT